MTAEPRARPRLLLVEDYALGRDGVRASARAILPRDGGRRRRRSAALRRPRAVRRGPRRLPNAGDERHRTVRAPAPARAAFAPRADVVRAGPGPRGVLGDRPRTGLPAPSRSTCRPLAPCYIPRRFRRAGSPRTLLTPRALLHPIAAVAMNRNRLIFLAKLAISCAILALIYSEGDRARRAATNCSRAWATCRTRGCSRPPAMVCCAITCSLHALEPAAARSGHPRAAAPPARLVHDRPLLRRVHARRLDRPRRLPRLRHRHADRQDRPRDGHDRHRAGARPAVVRRRGDRRLAVRARRARNAAAWCWSICSSRPDRHGRRAVLARPSCSASSRALLPAALRPRLQTTVDAVCAYQGKGGCSARRRCAASVPTRSTT